MYSDPQRVRAQKITICLDQYEHKLVKALAEYKGEQLSVLAREMLMQEVSERLARATASVGQADR